MGNKCKYCDNKITQDFSLVDKEEQKSNIFLTLENFYGYLTIWGGIMGKEVYFTPKHCPFCGKITEEFKNAKTLDKKEKE